METYIEKINAEALGIPHRLQGKVFADTMKTNLRGMIPANLSIIWPVKQALPKPCKRLLRKEFDILMFNGSHSLVGIDYQSLWVDWDGEGLNPTHTPLWSCNFYWFPFYGLMVASAYGDLQHTMGNSDFIDHGRGWGYYMRWYRLGCDHKRAYVVEKPGFDKLWACPECGNENLYNTGD